MQRSAPDHYVVFRSVQFEPVSMPSAIQTALLFLILAKQGFSVHMRSSAWRVESYVCNQTPWTNPPTVILRCWFQSPRLEPTQDVSGMEAEPQLSVRCPLDLHYRSGQNECLREVVWRPLLEGEALPWLFTRSPRIGVKKSAVFVSTGFPSHVGGD